ncbi:alpha/beta fold hydrolase [Actinophytocola sediminis]
MRIVGLTRPRIAALAAVGLTLLGLVYIGLPGGGTTAVPDDARAGDLNLTPCTYDTEAGTLAADCGTLVVPENRRAPDSKLIALPVTRIRATGANPAEPVFRLTGGPGATNMSFPQASRLTERHDVVLVGYRGVDGSTTLDCPEVTAELRKSADLVGEESFRRRGDALRLCARRLTDEGIDLDGYSLAQRVDDMEAARTALEYRKINLISTSAGTRTAMIYSWRHPEVLHRSAMIGVNPPGHFLWDPKITDDQLDYYATLCARDDSCSARTRDLVGSMRATAANLPDRWMFLPIKNGNVLAASMWGMFHATDAAAPLYAPATFDAWLSSADGDASGLWAMSTVADLMFPEMAVWGEFTAFTAIDNDTVTAYYRSGGDPGSVLGNAGGDYLWAGGEVPQAWPASPDDAAYQQVRRSEVETLLVGGTVDFSTPRQVAGTELLPELPNGRQVLLPELGHNTDFWAYQPEASEQLLTAFFDDGKVDPSGYDNRPVDFDPGFLSWSTIAWLILGALVGFPLVAIVLLGVLARRVRRRGRLGPKARVWLRTLAPVVLGLGGWLLAVLVVRTLSPATFIASRYLVVVSMGVAIGLGVFLAWTDRAWTPSRRRRGLAVALGGALLGALLGGYAADGLLGVPTALVGAAAVANLAVLVLDIVRDSSPAEALTSAAT